MRGISFLVLLSTFLSLSVAPAVARAIEKSFLNGSSEHPPIPADRGVILGSVEETVKTLGIISQALKVQFVIKEAIPGQVTSYGLSKTAFLFDYDDFEFASAPAGDYALNTAHWSSEMITWQFGAWNAAEPLGTFKLAPGEVIYIGHLVIEPGNSTFGPVESNKTLKMRVEDRFEQYRSELPPHLRDVVQKRLITLPAQIDFPHSERKVLTR